MVNAVKTAHSAPLDCGGYTRPLGLACPNKPVEWTVYECVGETVRRPLCSECRGRLLDWGGGAW
jgi:hypothetical protein